MLVTMANMLTRYSVFVNPPRRAKSRASPRRSCPSWIQYKPLEKNSGNENGQATKRKVVCLALPNNDLI